MARLKKGTVPKRRSDSKLYSLPVEVQEEIKRRLPKDNYAAVRAWLLAEHGMSAGSATLSKFYQAEIGRPSIAKARAEAVEHRQRASLESIQRRLARIEKHLGLPKK